MVERTSRKCLVDLFESARHDPQKSKREKKKKKPGQGFWKDASGTPPGGSRSDSTRDMRESLLLRIRAHGSSYTGPFDGGYSYRAPGRVRVQGNSTGDGRSRDELDGAVGMAPTRSLERFIQSPSGQRQKILITRDSLRELQPLSMGRQRKAGALVAQLAAALCGSLADRHRLRSLRTELQSNDTTQVRVRRSVGSSEPVERGDCDVQHCSPLPQKDVVAAAASFTSIISVINGKDVVGVAD